jgi:hypothetical protein
MFFDCLDIRWYFRQAMEGKPRTRLLSTVYALAIFGCWAASSAAAAAPPAQGLELDFAGDSVGAVAGEVAVPVECSGVPTGFCSGTLSLSWNGRRSVTPFAVQGGSQERILVPLRVEARAGRPARLSAVTSTVQPLGSPITRRASLYLE